MKIEAKTVEGCCENVPSDGKESKLRWVCLLLLSCVFVGAHGQVHWWPTEVGASTGYWLTKVSMRDVPDGAAYGGHFGWMTKATNGWAAGSGGIEHGGFVGIHNTGAEEYGWQPQAGWTLRTGLTRLVGWSFSAGVAYNQNIYDEVSAPDLEAVGSHWNALARLGITIANDSRMSLGLGILHTSNGAIKRPNLGINTPQANLVVRLVETPKRSVALDVAERGTWRHAVALGFGARDQFRVGDALGVQEVFAQSSYVRSHRYAWTGQVSLVHHGAVGAVHPDDAAEDSSVVTVLDRLQPNLSAGWTWMLGRARMDLLFGAVLMNPTPGLVWRYNKTQLWFSVHPNVDVLVALRFSEIRADYASLGVAMRLGQTENNCATCPKWGF